MEGHDITALRASLPTLDLSRRPTREEAMAAAASLGSFNQCELIVARFSGQPPWERHPDDELLHVLDGAVTITLLTEPDPTVVSLGAGSLFVVPAGVWHRSLAAESVTLLAATSAEGNESSFADDPRDVSDPGAIKEREGKGGDD